MKNKEILLDMIGDVDESLIPGQEKTRYQRKRVLIGAGLAAAVMIGLVLLPFLVKTHSSQSSAVQGDLQPKVETQSPTEPLPIKITAKVLAAAQYPDTPDYPEDAGSINWNEEYEAWHDAYIEQKQKARANRAAFYPFFSSSMKAFMSDTGEKNIIYSPLSLFMALSMTAQTTDGSTRKQLLDALGREDTEALQAYAKTLWEVNYKDDGLTKCVLANSLWTNDKAAYSQKTVDTLAQQYYASVYSGDPSDREYEQSLQAWLNEQTDGQLQDYTAEIKMNPRMMLTLASTVNFSGKWKAEFSEEKTKTDTFHSPSGDFDCDFMNAERCTDYYWGEKFSSVSLDMGYSSSMKLILPDEGISPEELFSDEEAVAFMAAPSGYDYQNRKFTDVSLSVPKFDVSFSIDLEDGLRKMGVTEIFDSTKGDFSPLTENAQEVYVSQAVQNSRVTVDEKGCKATTMTVIMVDAGAVRPVDHVDFVLDRPFVFEIMSDSGYPLFVGIVNNPA